MSFDQAAEEKKWQKARLEQIRLEEKNGGKLIRDENDPDEILRAQLGNLVPVYNPELEAKQAEARLEALRREAIHPPAQTTSNSLGTLGVLSQPAFGTPATGPAAEIEYQPSLEIIQDLKAPLELRLESISRFLKTEDQVTDAFSKLTMLYNIGSTTQLRTYLKRICVECLPIHVKHRLFMAEFLYDENVFEIRERLRLAQEAAEAAAEAAARGEVPWDPFAAAPMEDEEVSEEKAGWIAEQALTSPATEKEKTGVDDEKKFEEKKPEETKSEERTVPPPVELPVEEADPTTLHATYVTDRVQRKMEVTLRVNALERLANHRTLLQFCKTEWWMVLANPNLTPDYRYKLCLKIQKLPQLTTELGVVRVLFRVLFINLLSWVEESLQSGDTILARAEAKTVHEAKKAAEEKKGGSVPTPSSATQAYLTKLNSHLRYLILTLKSLRTLNEPEVSVHTQIELPLLKLLANPQVYLFEYNAQADLVDTLLSSTHDEHKELARQHLSALSGGRKALLSIYLNAQNVHTKAVEESVAEITRYLFDKVQNCVWNLEEVDERLRAQFPTEAVGSALDRVLIDQTQYGQVTLARFLTYLYNFICHAPETVEGREELLKRLGQELEEMSGTCSSGYITRLANTLSGFIGDLSVRIGVDDQIVAAVSSRLNRRIQQVADEALKEVILIEMTLDPPGKAFIQFFRENLPGLREELFLQFCGKNTHGDVLKGALGAELARQLHDPLKVEEATRTQAGFLDDTTFDLYLRKAISIYEGKTIL